MKIVTWNANMAFRKKQQIVLDKINPDILLIQECEHPDKFGDMLFPYYSWVGANLNKGLSIFSKYELNIITGDINSKWHVAFKINDILFIGIWAMNDKEKPENRYIGQVWNIVNYYRSLFDSKVVIFGDFNWNSIWDKSPTYTLTGKLQDVVELLSQHDIHSAYHKYFGDAFGFEKQPTFFMHRDENKSYHIDYIFAKNSILAHDWSINIGKYEDWIQFSDHMPLVLNLVDDDDDSFSNI